MNVYIICPDAATGGTECLHQLGYSLELSGANVSIYYHNESPQKKARIAFKHFGLKSIDKVPDSKENLIIFPENVTKFTLNFPKSQKAIYWLSILNFYPIKGISRTRDFISKYNIRRKRLNIKELKGFIHLGQSHFSKLFLDKHKFDSTIIGDHLDKIFLSKAKDAAPLSYKKLDQVCYNPAKGKRYTDYIITKYPSIKFVPIVNMTREQVFQTLLESKMYLDLGLHPGRDKIPREAALLGCCIATSKFGSAKNNIDVPIPQNYKFDVNKSSLNNIPPLINNVFENYEKEIINFFQYREIIKNEKQEFQKIISLWVDSLS
jgi:hypothetical protein